MSTTELISESIDALERQFELITHNMANVSTAGFKRHCSNFAQALAAETGTDAPAGTEALEETVDFSQGTLVQTDRTLDVGLYGKGFFVLESPEGPLYTRHGTFLTNQNGQIVDTMGRLVAGTAGPLLVPSNLDVSQIHIDSAGRVTAGQASLGQLQIVAFADQESQLVPAGLNCFWAPPEVVPKDAVDVTVRQGCQEASNVKLIDELVNMITVSRLYEANMKLLAKSSETTSAAISVAMG
jgi:flagellar basal-body rod protein FlgF